MRFFLLFTTISTAVISLILCLRVIPTDFGPATLDKLMRLGIYCALAALILQALRKNAKAFFLGAIATIAIIATAVSADFAPSPGDYAALDVQSEILRVSLFVSVLLTVCVGSFVSLDDPKSKPEPRRAPPPVTHTRPPDRGHERTGRASSALLAAAASQQREEVRW